MAHKFEHLLQIYRRPDGRQWGGAELAKATGGVVTRSYVTNLRKGRIESPGYKKLAAIARAMGFPPEVWFEEDLGSSREGAARVHAGGIAGKVEHLFETIRHPKTGEPYMSAEVARMSAGVITEEDVEGIRSGRIVDPLVSQVAGAGGGVRRAALLPAGPEQESLGPRRGSAGGPGRREDQFHTQGERPPAREGEGDRSGVVWQFGNQIDDA